MTVISCVEPRVASREASVGAHAVVAWPDAEAVAARTASARTSSFTGLHTRDDGRRAARLPGAPVAAVRPLGLGGDGGPVAALLARRLSGRTGPPPAAAAQLLGLRRPR